MQRRGVGTHQSLPIIAMVFILGHFAIVKGIGEVLVCFAG
jgi:hypothetical protein